MTEPSPQFAGFTPAAIQFLADLAEHNDRAWFGPRKAEYEHLLREPLERLCVALAEELTARDLPLLADPRRSPFRIYRDTRFSRDKAPYKTNLAASFPWLGGGPGPAGRGGPEVAGTGGAAAAGGAPLGAEERHGVGGYLSIRPGEMYLGGGMYRPPRPRIEAFRRALVADPDGVMATLADPGFVSWFGSVHSDEALKRVPPGYPADHPNADLLRWKDVIFMRRLSDDEVFSPRLPALMAEGFGAAAPVLRFLAGLA
jgi:uncharacterized protein (DUF2461 family)